VQPLYHRIAEDMIERIKGGELKPGDMLPSESQLSAEYSTSKMTVRQGLSLLVRAGYLRSVPGKGNYVEHPRYDLLTMHFDEMDIVGDYPQGVKLLEATIVAPDPLVQDKLGLTERDKVIVLKRLLYRETQLAAYDIKYMPYIKGKPLIEKLELFIGLQFPSGEFQVPGSCGIVEPAHPQAGRANHSIYIKIFKELG
jgi:GntR family transcriptional regulator